jgi:hypothetical protein
MLPGRRVSSGPGRPLDHAALHPDKACSILNGISFFTVEMAIVLSPTGHRHMLIIVAEWRSICQGEFVNI